LCSILIRILLNNQGTVVGRYALGGVVHGFIYQNGQYISLDVPGAAATYPQGINDSGEVVGEMYDSNFNPHGFSYSTGVFKMIDFPGGLFTPRSMESTTAGYLLAFMATPLTSRLMATT